MQSKRLTLAILVAIVLVPLVAWLAGVNPANFGYGRSAPRVTDPGAGHEVTAWQQCRDTARDQLKAPASAEFARYDASAVRYRGAGRYEVNSYVDAQNSFGAQVRTAYACTLRSEAGAWNLETFVME